MERRGNRRLQRRQQIGRAFCATTRDARGLVNERIDDQFRPDVTYKGAAVTLSPSWSIVGMGDFSGDGMADILLRNSNGALEEWIMNGSQIESSQAIAYQGAPVSLGSSWALAEVGDFNGDGKADLLWCNSSGALAEWTMNGAVITSSSFVTYQGQTVNPSGWQIQAQPTDSCSAQRRFLRAARARIPVASSSAAPESRSRRRPRRL